jgi:hypothetical protein
VTTRWIALFVAGAAAGALAAPARTASAHRASSDLYTFTLTGSQRTVVTKTGTTTDAAGCSFRHDDLDRRTISFATRGRRRLTIGATGLPPIPFAVKAHVEGALHREQSPVSSDAAGCTAPAPRTTSCGAVRLPARLVVRSKSSLVRLTGGFTRDRKRCATTLTYPDPFIVPTGSRLGRSAAGSPRILVGGHLVRRTTIGHVTETTSVNWRLVLTRV